MIYFLATLLFIYCIIGAIVGMVQWIEESWPKREKIKDEVTGVCTTEAIDLDKTVLFFILCGPLFWIAVFFAICFTLVLKLLK